jgi:cytoskeletal protein CcmA (bactofilin family)
MEYAAAKNTLCRQCGRQFVVGAAPVEAKAPVHHESPKPVESVPIFRRLESLWNRPHNILVECFECPAKQEVSSSASSTICPACSAHIDLRDYKIAASFSRSIRTRGDLHVSAAGDLSSSSVTCRNALIEGKLRGSLHCFGTAEFRCSGRIPGKLIAHHAIIDRKSNLQFFRQLKVGSIEIRGSMSGEVTAETLVTIHKHATLDGNVNARAINVEKGGKFSGQLAIGQRQLEQAELLPKTTASAEKPSSPAPGAVYSPGLPAAS